MSGTLPTQAKGRDFLGSAQYFRTFDATTTPALGADAITLATTYPGYASGQPNRRCRMIVFTGGDLIVTLANGEDQTLAQGLLAGLPLAIGPAVIKAASTATACFVLWD